MGGKKSLCYSAPQKDDCEVVLFRCEHLWKSKTRSEMRVPEGSWEGVGREMRLVLQAGSVINHVSEALRKWWGFMETGWFEGCFVPT